MSVSILPDVGAEPDEVVIEAGHTGRSYWSDLWRFRELFYFLAWRDVLVRYKQTALGIAWALIQPFLTMVIFTIVFGRLARLPSAGVPYPLLVLSALLPWQFVARSLSDSGTSVVLNSNLISKIYFPRMIVPLTAITVGIVDFLLSFVLLLGLMAWYGYGPTPTIFALLGFIPLAAVIAAGPGLLVAALTAKYRDFRYIVPFLVQVGLYISPVGFSSNLVPPAWRLAFYLNPVAGLIDGFRWAILGRSELVSFNGMLVSLGIGVLMLVIGTWYFRRTERVFADII